jgi:polyferredoxin
MAKKSTFRTNWPKYLLQWGSLAALLFFLTGLAGKLFPRTGSVNPEAYCPFGGLEALATYIQRGSLPCSMTTMQIVMGIVLAAAVILFSKLFCAYLCPIGTVEDLLLKARKGLKLKAVNIKDGSWGDKCLRIVKYGLLFWIVYMTVSSSELFCKNIDPYYAVATGFKGEITLWMSLVAIALVVLCGFFINRFWCKYICPLGAVSNTFKFWTWLLALVLLWWALALLGLNISWVWLLGAFCLGGWALEVFHSKPKLQILHVVVDQEHCGRSCYSCQKNCPYNIDVPSFGNKVTSVDCTLCGECVAACPTKALHIGVAPASKENRESKCRKWRKFIAPAITAVLLAVAFIVGGKFELPTIDVKWGIEDGMKLETLKISGLKTVKCYGSSMAFKARMEKVPGVHGVKTYVGTHTVVVSYDPAVTTAEKVEQQIFVPSKFKIASPDPVETPQLKVVTLRVEKMYDKMDLNYFGLQFRDEPRPVFGVESEYDCPVVVRVFMAPEAEADEAWFKEIVNRKALVMNLPNGKVNEIPMGLEYVRMEPQVDTIATADFLHRMFSPFKAEYNGRYPDGDTTVVRKRTEVYAGKPQYILEFEDDRYEKPIITRSLPFLSNHLSKEEGVIGTYVQLNGNLKPALQIRFAEPATAERIWELMTMEKWTITYKDDDVREEDARIKFDKPGEVHPYAVTE